MTSTRLTDDELLARARNGSSGDLFARLEAGETARFDSSRDAARAYCQILAREQRGYEDPDQIVQLLRRSILELDNHVSERIVSGVINGDENNRPIDLFEDVFADRGLNPNHVAGSDDSPISLESIIGGSAAVREAIIRYRREASSSCGHAADEQKRVIASVVATDLRNYGRLINPDQDGAYYFDQLVPATPYQITPSIKW